VTPALRLPDADGQLRRYTVSPPRSWPRPGRPIACRRAYAAVHVVADPLGDTAPGAPAALDWDATLAFRRHVWSYGLGVADAMDTAQRGMGLTWDATAELIRRSAAEARACGGRIVCGAGTDHAPAQLTSTGEVVAAYLTQVEAVEAAGSQVVLMASRQLARLARGADDYAAVYGRVLDQVAEPVILHWLGAMFDPALEGYWGADDLDVAAASVLAIIRDHADRVDGVKVSLLDPEREVRLRRSLPIGVALYTGDDFNYPALILGDEAGHADALLGVFAAITPAASAALQCLDRRDLAGYRAALDPTVPLARHLFAQPTYHYKTGIAFLSWLSGHQDGFAMVGGMSGARSAVHLATAFRLADAAGLFNDPDLAVSRMRQYLAVAGVDP
jgi:Protein of unknown function (DUF993)